MKAKDLAEQLLKYPDFDIEFDVCIKYPTHDSPYPEYRSFRIVGLESVFRIDKTVVLEYKEVNKLETKNVNKAFSGRFGGQTNVKAEV